MKSLIYLSLIGLYLLSVSSCGKENTLPTPRGEFSAKFDGVLNESGVSSAWYSNDEERLSINTLFRNNEGTITNALDFTNLEIAENSTQNLDFDSIVGPNFLRRRGTFIFYDQDLVLQIFKVIPPLNKITIDRISENQVTASFDTLLLIQENSGMDIDSTYPSSIMLTDGIISAPIQ